MKLSVETSVMGDRFGDEKAIEMIKNAGFDCFDYSMYWMSEENDILKDDYRERAEKLRKKSDELNIECNQAHAPFEIEKDDEFSVLNEAYKRLVRSIEVASIMGAKNIIVHAIKTDTCRGEDFYELNRRFYQSLVPYCEKFNICVSVENLFHWNEKILPILSDPAEHLDFVKSLNSPWLNICIDVGHSSITGHKPEDVIAAMDAGVLKTLHIHDNDGVDDWHLLPYTGSFEWDKIMAALSEINYDGELTFEIFGYLKRLPDDLIEDGLCFAEKVGRKLISKFNNK